ncbi:unnamed protein product [Arctia plantaginis]|uniref:Uncharacterized protein n=1 Tax=Arctia plantaginis TaxID=874455 RepID=A0A8S0ZN92_ARCPL|nr:unnamed protein product [Arctia plantaginis]
MYLWARALGGRLLNENDRRYVEFVAVIYPGRTGLSLRKLSKAPIVIANVREARDGDTIDAVSCNSVHFGFWPEFFRNSVNDFEFFVV